MNFIERKFVELHNHEPELTTPSDMDAFWEEVLHETRTKPLNAVRTPEETPMLGTETYRVVYEGIDGTPVHGYYSVPTVFGKENYPCIVFFHGYTGSKGLPEHFATYLMSGYAVFSIDIRGQAGDTGDLSPLQDGTTKGWVTKGITDPRTCYYKSIVTDALRAVDWAAGQPEVDPKRVGVSGGSQGGGLSLAVSALGDRHAFAIADIPNMCYMDWSIFNTTGSITEAAQYITKYSERLDTVLKTLSYFDNMNLAHRIRIPVLVSVGFKDSVCPPEAVFAAYNRITSPKQIEMYPFNGHTPGDKHIRKVLEFIRSQVQ
ncbi:acetylxylan esterase [Gorillibacterium sp. sgz5001074]|uniref:acetylxylan esterase n=1 Tax=Gorillibacterium sp. sgz5001074 TaxID=3446695 RepID=UPI003F67037E